MSLYEISVFIHVSAVVVGFGATFAEAIMFPVAMKAGERHLPYVHQLQLAINQRMAAPALGADHRHRHLPDDRRRLGLRLVLDQRHVR